MSTKIDIENALRDILWNDKGEDFAEKANKVIEQVRQLQAEAKRLKEENKNLKSRHFCPSPQLGKLATTCDCAHSDRHRAMDWASIDKLHAKYKELSETVQIKIRQTIVTTPKY